MGGGGGGRRRRWALVVMVEVGAQLVFIGFHSTLERRRIVERVSVWNVNFFIIFFTKFFPSIGFSPSYIYIFPDRVISAVGSDFGRI